MRLLSRPSATLSSIRNGGEGWGEEVLRFMGGDGVRGKQSPAQLHNSWKRASGRFFVAAFTPNTRHSSPVRKPAKPSAKAAQARPPSQTNGPAARRRRPAPASHGGQELRNQLAAIVENSNDAIFARRFDGTITTWNAAAKRIFGYSADEMIGHSSRLLVPPGRRDEYRQLLTRVRRGRLVAMYKTERLRKDGRLIQVSLTLSPVRDPAGRLTGFSTIARDISEHYELNEALAQRQRELDDLFEHASIGLILVSPAGLVLRANRAFLAMLERTREHVVGCGVDTFSPDPAPAAAVLKRLANRETLQNSSLEFTTSRGESRFALVDADGLWERGRLVQTRWFVRDVSRRRQLEREVLEISARERRGFAQDLHDGLGQQLGGVAYLANVLRERLTERRMPEAGSAARIFNLVRKAIEDARRMARGLSPIGDGPEGLLEALRDLATQTTELHGIRCRLICPQPGPRPDVTLAGHLYRIAQEAVNNALKHGRPRAISISLRSDPGQILLRVADNGTGLIPLAPERRGLGLRIMQYRATLIRGTLTVTPRHPRGAIVSCTVPWSPVKSSLTLH